MRPHRHQIWLLIALAFALIGCQRDAAPLTPAAIESVTEAAVVSGEMSALGVWRLEVDVEELEAEATYLEERRGSEQGDQFLLPLNRFITASTFELRKVGRVDEQLQITYRVTHPFAPPGDPAGAASATNRADLGFAGVVLFLADVESAAGQTFFDDVVANTSLIANADAYWQPGGMLARTSTLTANCFPGLNVVDETGTGNRVGISNGGSPTGNFGLNGWTRSDLGDAPFTGWTGYGVLHQGQAADRTVAINLGTESSISLDVALIAKYTDPRGGSTPAEKQANRLPSKPADFTKFAYRMPHGALDVSQCRVLTPAAQLTVTNGEPALIDCEILDWDGDAVASTASSLDTEPDIARILPSSAGPIALELDSPALLDSPVTGQPLTAGSPFSRYALTVAADRSAPDGMYTGLIRMTDPEALPAIHPMSVAYQAVSLQVRALGSWAHLFQLDHALESGQNGATVIDMRVDQAGNSYVLGSFAGFVNFAPEAGGPLLESEGETDTFVAGLKPNGDLNWFVRWPVNGFIEQLALSPGGALLYCELRGASPPPDLDPGHGTDLRGETLLDGLLALRTIDGSYAGAVTWPRIWSATRTRHVVLPNGHLLVALQFGPGGMDLDPGPGIEQASVSNPALALIELDAAGSYLKSALLGGQSPSVNIDVLRIASNAQGDIALCGDFEGTMDFDPGPGDYELTGPTLSWGNPYLLVLNAEGEFKWVHDWDTGGGTDIGVGLTLTPSGAVVLGGTVQSLFDSDPSDGIALLNQVGQSPQHYFICLSPAGTFRWSGTIGSEAYPLDILAVSDSTLLVSLIWSGIADLDPSPQELSLWAQSKTDSGLLALSTLDGHVVTHRQASPVNAISKWASIKMGAIAIFPTEGTLRWAGEYYGCQMDVDLGPDESLLPVVDGQNSVVIRLNPDGSW